MVKLSLIFLFVHCSSRYTTSASSQWMVCPVPATCTASPLLLSAGRKNTSVMCLWPMATPEEMT